MVVVVRRRRPRHTVDDIQPSLPCSESDPLAPVQCPAGRILDRYVAERTAELVALDPSLGDVAGEIAGLIAAGGKRLRPAFVYWGHRASGAADEPGVLHVAAAVEMLHTFALLHDDVMDRAQRRRGRRTAQHAFGDLHRDRGLAGDADWYGTSAAILAGDLAFVWADDLIDRAPLADGALARARRAFTTLRVEVMAGQYLDLRLDRLDAADSVGRSSSGVAEVRALHRHPPARHRACARRPGRPGDHTRPGDLWRCRRHGLPDA